MYNNITAIIIYVLNCIDIIQEVYTSMLTVLGQENQYSGLHYLNFFQK